MTTSASATLAVSASQAVQANSRPRRGRGGNHNAGAKHLGPEDIATVLQLHAQGLTQEQIATSFDPPKGQGTISSVLKKYSPDRTAQAKQILRASAPQMAMNIVKKGQPKDHVLALKGLGVLEEQAQTGLTVIVGGDATVNIGVLIGSENRALSPPYLPEVSERDQNP